MKKILQLLKNNFTLVIIIIAVIFGLTGGLIASLITRVYLLDNYYNIPFFGEINFSNNNGQKELIIRDAKKVVVEQNIKINETINTVENSLVGIFKKRTSQLVENETKKNVKSELAATTVDLNNFYQLDEPQGQGLIITSDGWIVSDFQLPDLSSGVVKNNKINLTNYVIITKDRKVYEIDKLAKDSLTPFSFLHITATNLSVRKFADKQEIKNGNLILAVNWSGNSFLSSIMGQYKKINSQVYSSDNFLTKLVLTANPPEEFKGASLFNLGGDIVALIDNQGEIRPITQLLGAINSLLQYKEVKRASLGINYLDLSSLVKISILPEDNDKGAIIYQDADNIAVVKGSPAEKAGLKAGDIIISVENFELNQDNNLTEIIQAHIAGDKVTINYLRGNAQKQVDVVLGQIK